MAEHTPAPWKLAESEPFVYALNEAGTNRFCLLVQPGWLTEGRVNRASDERTSDAECRANARLIAAAPDLLELVRAFVAQEVDYMTRNKLGDPEKQHNVKWARRVLARIDVQ